jgi:tetratricopeptide (TPR) repeat protein
LIIAVGLGAYHNSFQGPFILDDVPSIAENSRIRSLLPIWDVLSPSASSMVGGHPVVNFSLAINYALGGLAVWGYHALNLTIHLLAALTLFGIVRRTFSRQECWSIGLRQECWSTGVMECSERFGSSRVLLATSGASAEWIALAVAILWMVHPLQTEAVTYISQRGEELMGLFYLLTLYGFIRGGEGSGSAGASPSPPQAGTPVPPETAGSAGASPSNWPRGSAALRRWFVLSVVACGLGMATKEVMVTAPVMVLLYDRTFVSGSFREAWARHWRLYLGLACTWLVLGCLMAGSSNLVGRGVGYGLGITWWSYAFTECRVVVQYLRLALWPHPLVFDYGDAIGGGITLSHFAEAAPYALILAVLIVGILFELRWQPAIGFVGAWFFVILAPSSSVVPVAGQPMAEHRMYLPLAAVVTMAVVGAFEIGKRLVLKRGAVVGWITGGTVAVLFSFLTVERNRDYNSALSIWQDTVKKRPDNARAQNNLGLALDQLGRRQEAVGRYEQALRVQPDYAEAHNNMGLALVQQGELEQAIDQYRQALQAKPDLAKAHNNLGNALLRTGRLPEAIEQYEKALQIRPDLAEAHDNLGYALLQAGKVPAAIDEYQQALRIKPDYAEAHSNLGLALVQQGRVREAMAQWEQALSIDPDFTDAHYNLGLALQRQDRLPEAIDQYEQALRIQPDYAEAHYNMGIALERLGRTAEAIAQYEQALRYKPDFVQARTSLARARGGAP